MATDAITFIKAMGFEQVDLFGFSMGGMIAQEIALMEPQLVRKMICQRFSNRCLPQMPREIAWFQPRTHTIWRGAFRTADLII